MNQSPLAHAHLTSQCAWIRRTPHAYYETKENGGGGKVKYWTGAVCLRHLEKGHQAKKLNPLVSIKVQGLQRREWSLHKTKVSKSTKELVPPKTLSICGNTWTVQYVEGLLGNWGLHGRTEPAQQVILIGTDQHPQQLARTLLHEALHACLASSSGHQLGYEHEEVLIRCLEPALLSLLRDNPKLVEVLTK